MGNGGCKYYGCCHSCCNAVPFDKQFSSLSRMYVGEVHGKNLTDIHNEALQRGAEAFGVSVKDVEVVLSTTSTLYYNSHSDSYYVSGLSIIRKR